MRVRERERERERARERVRVCVCLTRAVCLIRPVSAVIGAVTEPGGGVAEGGLLTALARRLRHTPLVIAGAVSWTWTHTHTHTRAHTHTHTHIHTNKQTNTD